MKQPHDPAREELQALTVASRMVLALPVAGATLGLVHALGTITLRVGATAVPTDVAGSIGSALICAILAALGAKAFLEVEHDRRALGQLAALVTAIVGQQVLVAGGHALVLALPVLLWGLYLRFEQVARAAARRPRILSVTPTALADAA